MLRDSGQELPIEKLQILKHLAIDIVSVVKVQHRFIDELIESSRILVLFSYQIFFYFQSTVFNKVEIRIIRR